MNTQEQINYLQSKGYKIRYKHNRVYVWPKYKFLFYKEEVFPLWPELSPLGGTTEVSITDPQGVRYEGLGRCRMDEPFVKKIGREEGFKKAVELLPKETFIMNYNKE